MKRGCETCIKNKTIYCPNSDKCLSREDKPFYEDKYTILTKVEFLNETLKDYTEEMQTLKIQISAREEEYAKLENKYKELDKMCELYSKSLYNAELNQYKDNWNKLKEWASNFHKSSEFEQWEIVNKMQELEQGSDSE